MRQRMIKSPEEIDLIRHGARIGDIGGAAVVAAITEGVPEYEVAIAGSNAMIREIASTFPHAELRDTWVWFQSGVNTDGAHNWATSRRVERGDILSLNCFPMIAGYYTALERTLFWDQPSDAHLRLWEVNVKVHRRGLELIKPGAVCKDIALELNEIFEAEGLMPNRTFGYGHSFGVLCHYYGREAGLELREDIHDRPRAGHGRLDGTDDHGARGAARRRWLPRARHPRGRRGRGREHHRIPVRARAQHPRRLTVARADAAAVRPADVLSESLAELDPQVAAAIDAELGRQRRTLEMIASENFAPLAVMQAQGSVLTNKYAEGYPGKRYYGGCEHVDVVEQLAIDRVKALFGAQAANVQPHSGAQANAAAMAALLDPGDTILGLDLAHGGHLTHGMRLNFSGKLYNVAAYQVLRSTTVSTWLRSVAWRSSTGPSSSSRAGRPTRVTSTSPSSAGSPTRSAPT